VLKIFSEALQQNRKSGFGSLQRKGWEPPVAQLECGLPGAALEFGANEAQKIRIEQRLPLQALYIFK